MARQVITDTIWNELEKTLRNYGCHRWKNDRNIMEAILWKLRTGRKNCVLGKQPTIVLIVLIGVHPKDCGVIFFKLRGEIDTEWVFTDGSHIRAHQHASGARCGEERAIGRSCGGLASKIHLCADAHGNPVDFEITGGEVHDSQVAPALIERIEEAEYWIADKGYDSEEIRECARKKTSSYHLSQTELH